MLLDALQLVWHGTAVTTTAFIAPCDDRSILQYGSKSRIRGLDLLHVFKLVLHGAAVTTMELSPHVTTDPSPRMAANAPHEDWIC